MQQQHEMQCIKWSSNARASNAEPESDPYYSTAKDWVNIARGHCTRLFGPSVAGSIPSAAGAVSTGAADADSVQRSWWDELPWLCIGRNSYAKGAVCAKDPACRGCVDCSYMFCELCASRGICLSVAGVNFRARALREHRDKYHRADFKKYLVEHAEQLERDRQKEAQAASRSRKIGDAFARALEAIPADVWHKCQWPAERTVMVRATSWRIRAALDALCLPTVIQLKRRKDEALSRDVQSEMLRVRLKLGGFTWCRITKLDLSPMHGREELDKSDHLNTLHLLSEHRRIVIDDPEAELLAGALCQHASSLSHLDLTRNAIHQDGMSKIACVLEKMPLLVHLSLAYNKISDVGACRLEGVLTGLSRLTFLNLASNDLGNEAVANIAQVLIQISTLESLNLGGNSLLSVVPQVVGQYTRLAQLHLADCNIISSHHLAQTLTHLSSLWHASFSRSLFDLH